VGDVGGGGDLAVGQSYPVAAVDLVLVFGVGFAPAPRGPGYAFEPARSANTPCS
jgi:hypothetical protein